MGALDYVNARKKVCDAINESGIPMIGIVYLLEDIMQEVKVVANEQIKYETEMLEKQENAGVENV